MRLIIMGAFHYKVIFLTAIKKEPLQKNVKVNRKLDLQCTKRHVSILGKIFENQEEQRLNGNIRKGSHSIVEDLNVILSPCASM